MALNVQGLGTGAAIGSAFGPYGAAIGGGLGALGLFGGDEAPPQVEFNPYGMTTGMGTTSFDGDQATATLSPELQGFYDQLLGGATQNLTAAQEFDPYQAAEGLFGRMEGILAPGRERDRSQLESRLLSQGRLGSTGGMFDQQAQQGAVEAQRQNYLNQAFGQAQDVQQGMFSRGMQGLQGANALQSQLQNQMQLGIQAGGGGLSAAATSAGYQNQQNQLWPSFTTGVAQGVLSNPNTFNNWGGSPVQQPAPIPAGGTPYNTYVGG